MKRRGGQNTQHTQSSSSRLMVSLSTWLLCCVHSLACAPSGASLTLPIARAQADSGGSGTLTKRPGSAGGRPAGGTVAKRGAAARKPASGGRGGGGQGAGILRFYTDDAPGLKMYAAIEAASHNAPLKISAAVRPPCKQCNARSQRELAKIIVARHLHAYLTHRAAFETAVARMAPSSDVSLSRCFSLLTAAPRRCWSLACSSSLSSCSFTSGASSARAKRKRRMQLGSRLGCRKSMPLIRW